jgi:hypothetical protein|tara:strand:+ start:319 stop:897 length:579 start_codon:yes stop_codon:yes gene_type:complete
MEVKLIIPETWNDVTIETYQKYIKIQNGKGSDKNKIIRSIALLCGTTNKIVKAMPYSELLFIMQVIRDLVDAEPDRQNFEKLITLENEEYGFIPNMSKITTGEYIDLELFCKEPIENLHIIMSILYRKIKLKRGERYSIENYDPELFKEEVFKKCTMDIALGSLGFFLTTANKLATISLSYLENLNKTQQRV